MVFISFLTIFVKFSSVLRIIKEYVEQQERARNQAKDTKSNQATSSRRGDFSGLLGPGPGGWKMEADEGGVKLLSPYGSRLKMTKRPLRRGVHL